MRGQPEALIHDVRKDLGRPKLPFVIAAIVIVLGGGALVLWLRRRRGDDDGGEDETEPEKPAAEAW